MRVHSSYASVGAALNLNDESVDVHSANYCFREKDYKNQTFKTNVFLGTVISSQWNFYKIQAYTNAIFQMFFNKDIHYKRVPTSDNLNMFR